MKLVPLSVQLSLGITQDGSRCRMFVIDGTQELACHKLTRKELEAFLQSETAHLFKGRLQLDKNKDVVTISVKGKEVGIVNLIVILELTELK